MTESGKNTYYVYHHVCPVSKKVKYIGHGWKARAWIHGGRKTVLRGQDHLDWLEFLNSEGYLPCDYVKIVKRDMLKGEACKEEQSQIREIQPEFNKPQGLGLLKVTPDIMEEMVKLRELGNSYLVIGEKFGVSAMTSHRAINGMTKNAK